MECLLIFMETDMLARWEWQIRSTFCVHFLWYHASSNNILKQCEKSTSNYLFYYYILLLIEGDNNFNNCANDRIIRTAAIFLTPITLITTDLLPQIKSFDIEQFSNTLIGTFFPPQNRSYNFTAVISPP